MRASFSDIVHAVSHVGVVESLFRYPVKSMGGEELTRVDALPESGFTGDRAWAVIDAATGHVASAKHPRKWGALLSCRARLSGDGAVVTLPDGTEAATGDLTLATKLSDVLGRAVRIADSLPQRASYEETKLDDARVGENPLSIAAAESTFFDFAPIHLVTTSSLARLSELAPGSRFDVARFRPNLVVRTDAPPGFVEDEWIGRVLSIGDHVRLLVVSSCPRCVMTTLPQDDLPSDPTVLRTLADHNLRRFELLAKRLPSVGVYATVLEAGAIGKGDAVRLDGHERLKRVGVLARAAKRAVTG